MTQFSMGGDDSIVLSRLGVSGAVALLFGAVAGFAVWKRRPSLDAKFYERTGISNRQNYKEHPTVSRWAAWR